MLPFCYIIELYGKANTSSVLEGSETNGTAGMNSYTQNKSPLTHACILQTFRSGWLRFILCSPYLGPAELSCQASHFLWKNQCLLVPHRLTLLSHGSFAVLTFSQTCSLLVLVALWPGNIKTMYTLPWQ